MTVKLRRETSVSETSARIQGQTICHYFLIFYHGLEEIYVMY